MPKRAPESREDVTRTARYEQPLTRKPKVAVPVEEPTREDAETDPRTRFATRQMMVAEAIRTDFADKRYVPKPRSAQRGAWVRDEDRAGWVVRLTDPDGPSTEGGLKARLAILLVPEAGEGATLQCGWMDAAKMTSQLRSWDAVRRRHLARFGDEPEMDKQAYDTFLVDMRRCLLSYKLEVQLVVPDEAMVPSAPVPAPAPRGPGRPWLALAIGGAFLLGLSLGLLLHR